MNTISTVVYLHIIILAVHENFLEYFGWLLDLRCTCYNQLNNPRLSQARQNSNEAGSGSYDDEQSGSQAADGVASNDRGEEKKNDEWGQQDSGHARYR